jgi:hypothetical protein
VDDSYRQEFLLGEAVNLAEVKTLEASVTVPYGKFDHFLSEGELPARAGDMEWEFYAVGIRNLLTIDKMTGDRSEHVQIITE